MKALKFNKFEKRFVMCESKQDVIEAVIKKLQKGNQDFVETEQNNGDISQILDHRKLTHEYVKARIIPCRA